MTTLTLSSQKYTSLPPISSVPWQMLASFPPLDHFDHTTTARVGIIKEPILPRLNTSRAKPPTSRPRLRSSRHCLLNNPSTREVLALPAIAATIPFFRSRSPHDIQPSFVVFWYLQKALRLADENAHVMSGSFPACDSLVGQPGGFNPGNQMNQFTDPNNTTVLWRWPLRLRD